jgi:transposase
MAAPYSMDLRERVAGFVEAGGTRRGAARHFSISPSCVVKLMQRKAATGSVAPAPMGGKKPYALAGHDELVTELVAAERDITLDELRAKLAEREIAVSRTSLSRFLASRGLTLKKRRSMRVNRSVPTSPLLESSGEPNSRSSMSSAWCSSTRPGRRQT